MSIQAAVNRGEARLSQVDASQIADDARKMTAAFVAGIAGTGAMSLANAVAPVLGLQKIDFPELLGKTVASRTDDARKAGWILQFLNGGLLGCAYGLVWQYTRSEPTVAAGASLGFLHGGTAALGLPVMLQVHPRPPRVPLTSRRIAAIILEHAIFGAVTALTYRRIKDAHGDA